jgi:hypothetical protein
METAELVEGMSLVGEGNIKTGIDAFAAIDLNDDEFRGRQRKLMNIFVAEQTTAEELAQAMTDLHIAQRCMPMVPGQTSKNLIWNQVMAAARIARMAMERLRTGRGLQGTLICDDTG